jgi:excisionase family DNA binding protein
VAVQTTDERLWSLQETAAYLGVPVQTMYQWASRGTGPMSLRVGRHRRYRPAEVRRWIDAQERAGQGDGPNAAA